MDKNKINSCFNLLKAENSIFLNFLKAKFPIFHNSNFFFRDLQYGLMRFLEKKDITVSYPEAGIIAERLGKYFEDEAIFTKINSTTWRLNYPDFVTSVPGDPFDMKNAS